MSKEIVDIIDHYSEVLNNIYVTPIIFAEFTIIILIVFILRWLMLYGIEKNKSGNAIKTKKEKKYTALYLLAHCGIECLIAYVICYGIIKLTYANPTSYIINMIIGPAIGVICSVIVDNKFIIPLESATGLGQIISKKASTPSDKKENNNGITININNGPANTSASTFKPPVIYQSTSLTNSIDNYLDRNLAYDEEFNFKIIDTINDMKKEQIQQNEKIDGIKEEQSIQSAKIDDNAVRLQTTIEDLRILKESEMINKKIELKRMIYACLNQGFVTPEQYDKITLYYESYKNLGGNHEVEALYNNHFCKLDIHDERRANMQQTVVEVSSQQPIQLAPANTMMIQEIYGLEDRRDPNKRIYTYGEFDNIIEDNSDNN